MEEGWSVWALDQGKYYSRPAKKISARPIRITSGLPFRFPDS